MQHMHYKGNMAILLQKALALSKWRQKHIDNARLEEKTHKRKWINVTIRAGVTLLLFVLLFRSLSWSTLFASLTHVHARVLLLGLLIGSIGIVVSSSQWQVLLRAEQIFISFAKLLRLYVVGIAFSHFLPTGVGGDALKAIYVARDAGNGVGSASAVIMSRVTGFWGMISVAFVALAVWYTHFAHPLMAWFLSLSLVVLSLICGAIFSTRLFPLILRAQWAAKHLAQRRIVVTVLRISSAINASVRRPRSLCIATLVGVLFHIIASLNYYAYAVALHIDIPLYFYFIAVPLISLVAFLPISINGYGIREGTLVYIFSTVHVPVVTSLLLAFFMDTQVLFFGVIGGCLYLTMNSKAGKAKQLERITGYHYPEATRFIMKDYKQPDQSRAQVTRNDFLKEETAGCEPAISEMAPPSPVSASFYASEQNGHAALLDGSQDQQEEHLPTLERAQEPIEPSPSIPMGRGSVATSSAPLPVWQSFMGAYTERYRQKKLIVVLDGLLVLFAIFGGIAWYETLRATPTVTVYQVGPTHSVSQYIGGGGIVYPRQRLDVSYPAPELVDTVLVNAGDRVTPNQPLIQLDPGQLKAQVAQAADDLAAAAVYLNSVQSTGSSVTIAQAQQAYNQAKNKYDALMARMHSSMLQNNALVSPINGIVTAVNVNPGEVFKANALLLTIMDESSVIIHMQVPLSNLGQVHLGQMATVTPSALPNLSFQGTVSAVIPQADAQTDTFEVQVEVSNPNRMLLPGMSVFTRIQIPDKAHVLPRLAILNPDHAGVVFVVRNEHAYIQQVHIIGRSADTMYVDRGVSSGDKIVLVGLDKLQNAQQVRVKRVETSSTM